ncbi:MAG: hypothetical protein EP346_13495 [Bacteroidetes bacterium]|nr:MAG: hypothetical protein EP346_13495 [Bacteroidota bacterium]
MQKIDASSIQNSFLDRVKSILPPNTSLAQALSEKLGISLDSAYRRIRGETPISLSEAYILAEALHITFNGLTEESAGIVQFGYTPLYPRKESMEGYLTRLLHNLRMISKQPTAKVVYCSQDIPIFHNIRLEELGKFKLFYWMRSIINVEEFLSQKFSKDVIPEHLMQLCAEIYSEYEKIASVELWSESTVNSTLRQVQYYWESGLFETDDDFLSVIQNLRTLIQQIEESASLGKKTSSENSASYELYISEIELTTNCALVEMENQNAVFLGHHTFNMLETTHGVYTEQTQQWFKNMVGKATLVSSVGEKYRYQFFHGVHRKIDELERLALRR